MLTGEEWRELQVAACWYYVHHDGPAGARAWHALDKLRRAEGLLPLPREWPADAGGPAQELIDADGFLCALPAG
jgi:hypothetical protein